MTEAMPFLQKCDITFLRPPPIGSGVSFFCAGPELSFCRFWKFFVEKGGYIFFRRQRTIECGESQHFIVRRN